MSARAVKGAHQLSLQPLAQRMLLDKLFELGDEFSMASYCEVVLDPVLENGEPLILQSPSRIVREALVSQIQKSRPPPERQCLFALAFLRKLLEPLQIELVLLDAQDVARISRQKSAVPELLS